MNVDEGPGPREIPRLEDGKGARSSDVVKNHKRAHCGCDRLEMLLQVDLYGTSLPHQFCRTKNCWSVIFESARVDPTRRTVHGPGDSLRESLQIWKMRSSSLGRNHFIAYIPQCLQAVAG